MLCSPRIIEKSQAHDRVKLSSQQRLAFRPIVTRANKMAWYCVTTGTASTVRLSEKMQSAIISRAALIRGLGQHRVQ